MRWAIGLSLFFGFLIGVAATIAYFGITPLRTNDANWAVAWYILALTVATILLGVVAAFQDKIRGWLQHPRLDLSVECKPPDCHQTVMERIDPNTGKVTGVSVCYYFRLSVSNQGDARAEQVEVRAHELRKKQNDGSFGLVESFSPMNLRWSYTGTPFLEGLSPGMTRHCDLGHIISPAKRSWFPGEDNPALGVSIIHTLFSLDLEVKPFTMSHLVPPGEYQVDILIAAGNSRPVRKVLEMVLPGTWYGTEGDMLGKGISLRLL